MKIGVTTFYCDFNYGAVLQATALLQALLQRGYDARIIHSSPPIKDKIFRSWKRPSTFVRNILLLPNYKSMLRRVERTREFLERYQRYTEHFSGHADLLRRWPEMDAYITGSDQVWNVEQGVDPVFFLKPADPLRARLISYAASFGRASIPVEREEEVASALRRFHNISVREESGRGIVESLLGRAPEVVCDPVFLHDAAHYESWFRTRPGVPPEYIFVYAIRKNEDLEKTVSEAKKHYGLPVVQLLSGLSHRAVRSCDMQIHDAGPAEFLSLLRNSKCVCTNSFHGSAFSLVFRKPFLVTAALLGRNTRIENLMSIFGETRRVSGVKTDFTPQFWESVDSVPSNRWEELHNDFKAKGFAYLDGALEKFSKGADE